MDTLTSMMHAHPGLVLEENMDLLSKCLDDCVLCAQTCIMCADACLGETEHLKRLVRCIRLNMDCAEVCTVTANMLGRQTEAPWVLVRQQLNACLTACELCGAECEMHAEWHEHCRICGDVCRKCALSCQELMDKLPQ